MCIRGPFWGSGVRGPVGGKEVCDDVVRTMVRGLIRGTWVRGTNEVLVRLRSEILSGVPGSKVTWVSGPVRSSGTTVQPGFPDSETVVRTFRSEVRSGTPVFWVLGPNGAPDSDSRVRSWSSQGYLFPKSGGNIWSEVPVVTPGLVVQVMSHRS